MIEQDAERILKQIGKNLDEHIQSMTRLRRKLDLIEDSAIIYMLSEPMHRKISGIEALKELNIELEMKCAIDKLSLIDSLLNNQI